MSKVGDVDKMYGKNFSIVTTNASASDILNDSESSFVSASLIVASPIDNNGNDLGYPTLLATDADGRPIRLTYTIKPGNGLVLAYTYSSNERDFSEVLSLAIDHDTLQTSNGDGSGYLFVSAKGITEYSQYLGVDDINNIDVDLRELADDNKIVVTHVPVSSSPTSPIIARLTVDASKLVDNYTLKTNQSTSEANSSYFSKQKISVNLMNLIDKKSITLEKDANGREVLAVDPKFINSASSTTYGVVKLDNSTIKTGTEGRIYVDTNQLKLANKNGTPGLAKIHPNSSGSVALDSNNFLIVNSEKMNKCSEADYGLCKADGVTIKAVNNGVLKVITEGLSVATGNKLGIVKPDGAGLTIDKSGTLHIDATKLPKSSPSAEGVVKYDNASITKNSQGQLTVTKSSQWDTAIADLNTKISNFSEQLAAIRSELINVLATINKKVDVPFNLYTMAGLPLKTIMLKIPNISNYKHGTHAWNSANCSGSFKISYGAGYIFSVRLTGASNVSWVQNCNIVVNGQSYGMNQDIKLDSNDAQCSLELHIAGYGNSKSNRTQGSFSLEFKDQAGNPLKSVNLFILNSISSIKLSDFACNFNAESATAIAERANIVVSSAKVSDLIQQKSSTLVTAGQKVSNKMIVRNNGASVILSSLK